MAVNINSVNGGANTNSPQACYNRIDPANPRLLTTPFRTVFRPQGGRALDGRTYFAFFTTAMRPNGPHCQSSTVDGSWGHASASSRHTGGVHVLMGDGVVKFVSDNINTGDASAVSPGAAGGGPSPYGTWGALGTRAGGETVGDF